MPESVQTATRLVASPSSGLTGQWRAAGDKSVSHRAIILASLAQGISVLHGLATGDDVKRTLAAVQAFGAAVESAGAVTRIRGALWSSPTHSIDCGNSGTAARLLIGAIAGMPGMDVTIGGDRSLSGRPMQRLVGPLIRMGASIEAAPGCRLPIRVMGRKLAGITHRNVPASAQVKTALMFAGLGAEGATRIVEPIKSRAHGERLLAQFGCAVSTGLFEGSYMACLVPGRPLQPADARIAGDPSSAAFPLVAALVAPNSCVSVSNLLLSPERRRLFDVLKMMGAEIRISEDLSGDEPIGSIACRTSRLQGVEVPAKQAPAMIDEFPVAAVAAAFATGVSVFRGLAELRHKESDRLERLAAGLNACGVSAQVDGDDLIVHGIGRPHGNALIDSHGDHRIAMAFAVLGLASRHSVTIEGAEMIRASFPEFVDVMAGFGARIGWTA